MPEIMKRHQSLLDRLLPFLLLLIWAASAGVFLFGESWIAGIGSFY
jgi:hypothetical protein